MNITKKFLALFLSVIMVLSMVSMSVYAESVADYEELNAYINQVEALDRSIYTDESLALLDSVVDKIDFNLDVISITKSICVRISSARQDNTTSRFF